MSSSELDKLVGRLLQAVTAVDPESPRGRNFRTRAVGRLQRHNYGRTNQFEVQKRLEGLEEKFRILNEEDLADALQQRRTELRSRNISWTPEILSLFLELSDDPLIKTNLEDLRVLVEPEEPPQLTWEEIVRDNPLDETGVWDDIDYGAESSGDEYTQLTLGNDTVHSVKPLDVNDTLVHEPTLDSKVDGKNALTEILQSQFWSARQRTRNISSNDGQITVTELQAVREVLFMLSGFPTALFARSTSGEIMVNSDYALANISNSTFYALLTEVAAHGSKLSMLEDWVSINPESSLLQTFSAEVELRIRTFKLVLADLQQRFVRPGGPTVISFSQLLNEIEPHLAIVFELTELVSALDGEKGSAFQCLELLYNRICALQAIGDVEIYREVMSIFSVCFDAYLVPIKAWMLYVEVPLRNDTLFIEKISGAKTLDTLWHDHYQLRRDLEGNILAPSFLAPLVNIVFAAGKSVLFHDALLSFTLKKELPDSNSQVFTLPEEALESSLIPFSELVRTAFEKYVHQRQSPSVELLPGIVKRDTELFKSLRGMHFVYFMTDGNAASQITSSIFGKMDKNKTWNDRFLLTDLLRSVCEVSPNVERDCIVVRISNIPLKDRKSLRALAAMKVEYNLPWAVANIVQRSSLGAYQAVYTLLCQILRAKHILEKDRLLPPPSTRLPAPKKNDDVFHLTRFKLIWFSNVLLNHIKSFVLAPQIEKLHEDIEKSNTIDEMISVHEAFVKDIESLCMLSKNFAPIYDSIIAILDLAQPLADLNPFSEGRLLGLSTSLVTISRPGRGRRRRRKQEPDEDEDDEDDDDTDTNTDEENDGNGEGRVIGKDTHPSSSKIKLRKIAASFERHVGFIRAGIKGISRVGEGSAWSMLSELLELKDERPKYS